MLLKELFEDKSLKAKQKVEQATEWLLAKKISVNELTEFAGNSKDPVKASCIESLEFATRSNPKIANESCLKFAIDGLAEKAPRIKWESAKVIGNIAALFPGKMNKAIDQLLNNTEHSGAVVRWSAAFALAEIYKSDKKMAKKLLPVFEAIVKREEKSGIRKIYQAAIKG